MSADKPTVLEQAVAVLQDKGSRGWEFDEAAAVLAEARLLRDDNTTVEWSLMDNDNGENLDCIGEPEARYNGYPGYTVQCRTIGPWRDV